MTHEPNYGFASKDGTRSGKDLLIVTAEFEKCQGSFKDTPAVVFLSIFFLCFLVPRSLLFVCRVVRATELVSNRAIEADGLRVKGSQSV